MSARIYAPDIATIAGRLRSERQRLGFSRAAFASLTGVAKNTAQNWEIGSSSPNAVALAAFAEAGADVLYIVTGWHMQTVPSGSNVIRVTLAEGFSMMEPADRRRLLLDLLAGELAA